MKRYPKYRIHQHPEARERFYAEMKSGFWSSWEILERKDTLANFFLSIEDAKKSLDAHAKKLELLSKPIVCEEYIPNQVENSPLNKALK